MSVRCVYTGVCVCMCRQSALTRLTTANYLGMLRCCHWQGKTHSASHSEATRGRGDKGVKKAILPANECRCKCVCVCHTLCMHMYVCVCASPCLRHHRRLPSARLELKSKQKCFHVWACQQICPQPHSHSLTHSFPFLPLSSHSPSSNVSLLCAKAFCLISCKHQSRESKRNYPPQLHEKKEQKKRKVQVG